ncbi:MAG: BREX protein BrxB domain-containing protein [Porticoccaceae bacterium]
MSNRLNRLIQSYTNHISLPWMKGLANEQRVLFAVYHKEDELKLRARVEEFRLATESAGHPWLELNITRLFPDWMAQQKYREEYFEDPQTLAPKYKAFIRQSVEMLAAQIQSQADEKTLVALIGCGTLFGFASVSDFVKQLAEHVPGRLLVLFPGEYVNNGYRLLDARDGWGYQATAITADN